jgi:hypothetical protein
MISCFQILLFSNCNLRHYIPGASAQVLAAAAAAPRWGGAG